VRRVPVNEHADHPVVDRPDVPDSGAVQPHGRLSTFDGRLGLDHELASRLEVEITGQYKGSLPRDGVHRVASLVPPATA
jgi:hypothetical protein